MRTSYLICYDICDDKRLRKVFQIMRGFGDHLHIGLPRQDANQALSDQLVIVCDQYSDHGLDGEGPVRGTDTDTRVPPEGGAVTAKDPPSTTARSRMPRRPIERAPVSSASVMPRPLSPTSRVILSPASTRRTSTALAPECRATFVRVS